MYTKHVETQTIKIKIHFVLSSYFLMQYIHILLFWITIGLNTIRTIINYHNFWKIKTNKSLEKSVTFANMRLIIIILKTILVNTTMQLKIECGHHAWRIWAK